MALLVPMFKSFFLTTALSLMGLAVLPGNACDIDDLKSGVHTFQFKLDTQPRTRESLSQRLKDLQAHPNDPSLWLELGRDYLDLADKSHWEYLEQAETFFEKLATKNPDNPIVLMLLGLATGGKALNQQPSNMRRLKWAKDGFKMMDRALKLEPNCFFLHLLRGEAQIFAHPILGRSGRMDKDAGFVLDFTRRPEYERLPNYTKARIHLFLGTYMAKRRKDPGLYRGEWARVLILAPNTPMADEAQAKLLGAYNNPGFDEE